MTLRTLTALTSVALALSLASRAQAFDFGVGVEGAATATGVRGLPITSSTAGDLGLGLMLEERFDLEVVELDLWEDGQTPVPLQTGGAYAASYIPLDVGLRVGLGFSLLRPYVGVLVNDLHLTQRPSDGAGVNSNLLGAGGDIGCDLVILMLRIGVELRGFETLTPLASAPGAAPPGGYVIQGLLSARASF